MPSDDLPDWLAKDFEPPHFSAWDEELQVFTVLPKIHPQTGQPLPGEDEREDWPLGIVTADGHWLLPPKKVQC